ncbi:hypothetical protein ACFPRL_31935 [Pseudoclavibacter helvolus]
MLASTTQQTSNRHRRPLPARIPRDRLTIRRRHQARHRRSRTTRRRHHAQATVLTRRGQRLERANLRRREIRAGLLDLERLRVIVERPLSQRLTVVVDPRCTVDRDHLDIVRTVREEPSGLIEPGLARHVADEDGRRTKTPKCPLGVRLLRDVLPDPFGEVGDRCEWSRGGHYSSTPTETANFASSVVAP